MADVITDNDLRNSLDAVDQSAQEANTLKLGASDIFDSFCLSLASPELSDKRTTQVEWKQTLRQVVLNSFAAMSAQLKMLKVVATKTNEVATKSNNNGGNNGNNNGGSDWKSGGKNGGSNWKSSDWKSGGGKGNGGNGGNGGWNGNGNGWNERGGQGSGPVSKCAAFQFNRCGRGPNCRFTHQLMSMEEFETYVTNRRSTAAIPLPAHLGGPVAHTGPIMTHSAPRGPYMGFPPSGFPAIADAAGALPPPNAAMGPAP
jgi:hypothetical protein